VFAEKTRCRHREHLFRRIAWRLQALAEGDLTERARERASQLARDADLRMIAPRGFFTVEGEPVRTTGEPCSPASEVPGGLVEVLSEQGARQGQAAIDWPSVPLAAIQAQTWNCPAGVPEANHAVQGAGQRTGPEQWPARGRDRTTDALLPRRVGERACWNRFGDSWDAPMNDPVAKGEPPVGIDSAATAGNRSRSAKPHTSSTSAAAWCRRWASMAAGCRSQIYGLRDKRPVGMEGLPGRNGRDDGGRGATGYVPNRQEPRIHRPSNVKSFGSVRTSVNVRRRPWSKFQLQFLR